MTAIERYTELSGAELRERPHPMGEGRHLVARFENG